MTAFQFAVVTTTLILVCWGLAFWWVARPGPDEYDEDLPECITCQHQSCDNCQIAIAATEARSEHK